MKRKRLSKIIQDLDQILDENNEENNQLTTTSQAYPLSTTSTTDGQNTNSSMSNIHNPNVNSLTSDIINLNEINSDNNSSKQTLLIKQDIGGRTLGSKVWLYAKKLDDGKRAACSLCDFTCSCHSHSTSTIRQHLISKHHIHDLILQPSIHSKPVITEALKEELHELCYYAIIKDGRSFNDLHKTGIKTLISKLCPGYSPPHRNQVSRHLKLLYNHHYELFKEELKQVYRLSVTLDFWSNRRGESFLCVTGHWFTDDIDLVSKVIDFSCFNYRHTGVEIAKFLKDKFIELGIYEKIICITCDGAANLTLACEYLCDDIIRLWCCAHRLHLVVINALGFWLIEKQNDNYSSNQSLTASTTTIKTTTSTIINNGAGNDSVDVDWDYELNEDSWTTTNGDQINQDEYNDEIDLSTSEEDTEETDTAELIYDTWSTNFDVDVNPTEQQHLIINLLKKCRAIAKVMKKSSIISQFVRQEQKSLKSKKNVNTDCKTRWNSTFILVESLIDLKQLIIKLFSEKRSLKLRLDQIQKLSTIELNSDNWDLLTSLYQVLCPFFLATTMMSGKKYPTVGFAYYAIQKLKFFLAKHDANEQIKKMKKLLLDKLDKYFHNDYEQLKHLQRFAYFDPTSHLCLTDKEKQSIEFYIKNLIYDNAYPLDLPTIDSSTASSSTFTSSSASSTTIPQSQLQDSTNTQSKPSIFDKFIAACGEEDDSVLSETVKTKSKRIQINEEIKYFKLFVQELNLKVKPCATSAIQFWKLHKDRLPLLTHLAKIHLTACATSVPSESAFSLSSYIARKERSRLSGQNLAYTVFLKDKILLDG